MDILLIVRNTDIDIRVLLQSEDYVDIVSAGYEDLDKLSRFSNRRSNVPSNSCLLSERILSSASMRIVIGILEAISMILFVVSIISRREISNPSSSASDCRFLYSFTVDDASYHRGA